jgi:hypothetical protein
MVCRICNCGSTIRNCGTVSGIFLPVNIAFSFTLIALWK